MTEKLTILSIPNRRYPTEQTFLLEIMSKRLGQRGHRVISIIQSETPSETIQFLPWNHSQVYVTPAKSHQGRWNRLLNLAIKIQSIHQIYKTKFNMEKPDIIQIRNDWAVALWALLVVKRRKVPIVFQYSFPATKSYFERANSQPVLLAFLNNLTGRLLQKILIFIMYKVDHILPISEWMQAELADWGIPEEKMTPFPMGFNETILQENIDGKEIRSKFNIQDFPAAIYFGAMDKFRNLEFILEAFHLVIKSLPNARLLMVGGIQSEIEILKKKALELNILDNVIFTGLVPHSEIPKFILASDIGVSPIPPIPKYIVSSPTKLVETLGNGRPVVCNDIPEQEKTISESGGGICVPYIDTAFASAMIKLLESPGLRDEMGRRGQGYILKKRSYSSMTDNLEEVYKNVLSAKKLSFCENRPFL